MLNRLTKRSQLKDIAFIQNNQYTVAMMILTHKIKKANGLIKNTIVCVAILRIPIQIWTNSQCCGSVSF